MKKIISTPIVAWLGLALIGALYALFRVDFGAVPFEDAAILMRYAKHLAEGHGIVWNIGEAPLDGATDFLFMAALAGLHSLGLELEVAVYLLGILAHFLTVALLFWALWHRWKFPLWLAWSSALFFLLGPGLWLTAAYFGTAFFALWVALMVYVFLELTEAYSSRFAWLFALFFLLSGLTRPEGVLLGSMMALVLMVFYNRKENLALLLRIGLLLGLIGSAYFLWRWDYFGKPLPHPFYKKGGGTFYPFSVRSSLIGVVKMAWPFLIVLGGDWLTRSSFRAKWSVLPLIGGMLMWGFLSDEMNFGFRFQYPLLAMVVLMTGHQLKSRKQFPPFTVYWGLGLFLLLGWQVFSSGKIRNYPDGRYAIAKGLAQYADKGYKLVSTEAGLLPLYSEWKSMDSWGLNDRRIVSEGGLTKAYLSAWQPDVILFHGDMLPQGSLNPSQHSLSWQKMNNTLQEYAEANRYTLAAAYGLTPYFVHFYFVNPGTEDHDALVSLIRKTPYPWFLNQQLCWDYRLAWQSKQVLP